MNEGEEGRVGILMCAGCAFVCLLLVVSIALTEVAMQDRRLVSCADALASAGVSGASASTVFVGDGVSVSWVSVSSGEVEVGVRAHPRVSLLPPMLRGAVVPELVRTSSARLRGAQGSP